MKEWTGQVSRVTRTPWQEVILWSFKIDQSERVFRMGKKEPTFKEGEWITFQERNSNVHYASIKEASAEMSASATSVSTSSQPEGAQPNTVTNASGSEESAPPAADVGARIQYQAARRDACNIVVAALAADHLPHAANVAKGKRLDLLLGYVKEVTNTLLTQEKDNA